MSGRALILATPTAPVLVEPWGDGAWFFLGAMVAALGAWLASWVQGVNARKIEDERREDERLRRWDEQRHQLYAEYLRAADDYHQALVDRWLEDHAGDVPSGPEEAYALARARAELLMGPAALEASQRLSTWLTATNIQIGITNAMARDPSLGKPEPDADEKLRRDLQGLREDVGTLWNAMRAELGLPAVKRPLTE